MVQPEWKPAGLEDQFLTFKLDQYNYALRLEAVDRIVRMVAIVPLPKAPGIVMGVINWQGLIVPVLNIRKRFGLRDHAASLNDQLIIAHTGTRSVGLAVDCVTGVLRHRSDTVTLPASIAPGIDYVAGVALLGDDVVFIHDLDRFLALEEAARLDEVMARVS